MFGRGTYLPTYIPTHLNCDSSSRKCQSLVNCALHIDMNDIHGRSHMAIAQLQRLQFFHFVVESTASQQPGTSLIDRSLAPPSVSPEKNLSKLAIIQCIVPAMADRAEKHMDLDRRPQGLSHCPQKSPRLILFTAYKAAAGLVWVLEIIHHPSSLPAVTAVV